jgi:hypothetical protein
MKSNDADNNKKNNETETSSLSSTPLMFSYSPFFSPNSTAPSSPSILSLNDVYKENLFNTSSPDLTLPFLNRDTPKTLDSNPPPRPTFWESLQHSVDENDINRFSSLLSQAIHAPTDRGSYDKFGAYAAQFLEKNGSEKLDAAYKIMNSVYNDAGSRINNYSDQSDGTKHALNLADAVQRSVVEHLNQDETNIPDNKYHSFCDQNNRRLGQLEQQINTRHLFSLPPDKTTLDAVAKDLNRCMAQAAEGNMPDPAAIQTYLRQFLSNELKQGRHNTQELVDVIHGSAAARIEERNESDSLNAVATTARAAIDGVSIHANAHYRNDQSKLLEFDNYCSGRNHDLSGHIAKVKNESRLVHQGDITLPAMQKAAGKGDTKEFCETLKKAMVSDDLRITGSEIAAHTSNLLKKSDKKPETAEEIIRNFSEAADGIVKDKDADPGILGKLLDIIAAIGDSIFGGIKEASPLEKQSVKNNYREALDGILSQTSYPGHQKTASENAERLLEGKDRPPGSTKNGLVDASWWTTHVALSSSLGPKRLFHCIIGTNRRLEENIADKEAALELSLKNMVKQPDKAEDFFKDCLQHAQTATEHYNDLLNSAVNLGKVPVRHAKMMDKIYDSIAAADLPVNQKASMMVAAQKACGQHDPSTLRNRLATLSPTVESVIGMVDAMRDMRDKKQDQNLGFYDDAKRHTRGLLKQIAKNPQASEETRLVARAQLSETAFGFGKGLRRTIEKMNTLKEYENKNELTPEQRLSKIQSISGAIAHGAIKPNDAKRLLDTYDRTTQSEPLSAEFANKILDELKKVTETTFEKGKPVLKMTITEECKKACLDIRNNVSALQSARKTTQESIKNNKSDSGVSSPTSTFKTSHKNDSGVFM